MNITDEARRKGQEQFRKNLDLVPKGGIINPIQANAEFARLIGDRCFCNGACNGVCKCGKKQAA
jgi:hypothetical protein